MVGSAAEMNGVEQGRTMQSTTLRERPNSEKEEQRLSEEGRRIKMAEKGWKSEIKKREEEAGQVPKGSHLGCARGGRAGTSAATVANDRFGRAGSGVKRPRGRPPMVEAWWLVLLCLSVPSSSFDSLFVFFSCRKTLGVVTSQHDGRLMTRTMILSNCWAISGRLCVSE